MQAHAEQILTARKRLGLSRAAAAQRLGVSPRQLARYEQGESPIPLTLAVSLADALGTSIDALIGREAPLSLAVELNGRRFTLADDQTPSADPGPALGPAQLAALAEAIAAVQAAGAAARPGGKRLGIPPTTA
jgi:transcriptional regulator with XRE-family HTH domain